MDSMTISGAKTFDTKGLTPKYVDKSQTIVLNQKCIYDGIIDWSQAQYLSDAQRIPAGKYLKAGDLVINSTGTGTAGRSAYVDELPAGYKLVVDSHLLIVRFASTDISRYFAYFLYSQEALLKTLLIGSSGQGELDKTRVFDIKFPYNEAALPALVRLLTCLDGKIALNRQMNAELETMARNMYSYWFVQFEFPNAAGRPYKTAGGELEYNEAAKREIPRGWSVKRVADFLDVITGKEDANFATEHGPYAYFTCGKPILRCDTPAYSGRSVLIAGNGTFDVKYFNGDFNAYQRVYVLTPRDDRFAGVIYRNALDSIARFTQGSNGSIVKFITKGDVENIPVLVPDNLGLLRPFNVMLDLIERNNNESAQLAELRDWLLPMLMRGHVRPSK
jgi:type I restriction enzyme, S subunit